MTAVAFVETDEHGEALAFVETVEHGEAELDLHEWRAAAAALQDMGYRVQRFTQSELLSGAVPFDRSTPLLGDRQSLAYALRSLGLIKNDDSLPERSDYPSSLSWFLGRRGWASTLGQAMATTDQTPFVKPRGAKYTKRFTGLVLNEDNAWTLERQPPDMPVWCSDVLSNIASEWRCYVLGDAVECVCYSGDERTAPVDGGKVAAAIEALKRSGEGSAAYALDVGVVAIDGRQETVLIEVNDGFALGLYPGCPTSWYARMMVARWDEMVEQAARPRAAQEDMILVCEDGRSRVLLRGARATVSFRRDTADDENTDANITWVDWRSGNFRELAGGKIEMHFVLRKGKLVREHVQVIVADSARGTFTVDGGGDWYEE